MNVPLDRLYTFLRDQCDQDIIIYRWYPHGSRKISDCKGLTSPLDFTQFETISLPHMVCHDQEPLEFDRFVGATTTLLRQLTLCTFNMYDKMLLCHSELQSAELEKFEKNDAIGVYWWCHALIARDWFRFAQHDSGLQHKKVKHDFLVYNRAWSGTREYRLKFAEMLIDQGLASCCKMGFNAIDDDKHYTQHQFQNRDLTTGRQDLQNYFFENFAPASASADYVTEDYQSTQIEVVLETLFDDQRLHLTEKALRPIACGQPFILAATPGSLAYLRSYGFKTFDSCIDETYDTIQDPSQRLQAIVQVMKDFAHDANRARSLDRMHSIARYNQQHFFSAGFFDHIVQEYKQNLQTGISKLNRQRSGKNIKTLLRRHGSVQAVIDNTTFTRQDLRDIWHWLKART